MRKLSVCATLITACALAAFAAPAKPPARVGVVLSGSGIMDGTEISEAVLTMLALEKGKAQIVYMAPNIPQAKVF